MIKGYEQGQKHLEFPYFGLDDECDLSANKSLHGIFNSDNLNANFRRLDQYY